MFRISAIFMCVPSLLLDLLRCRVWKFPGDTETTHGYQELVDFVLRGPVDLEYNGGQCQRDRDKNILRLAVDFVQRFLDLSEAQACGIVTVCVFRFAPYETVGIAMQISKLHAASKVACFAKLVPEPAVSQAERFLRRFCRYQCACQQQAA